MSICHSACSDSAFEGLNLELIVRLVAFATILFLFYSLVNI